MNRILPLALLLTACNFQGMSGAMGVETESDTDDASDTGADSGPMTDDSSDSDDGPTTAATTTDEGDGSSTAGASTSDGSDGSDSDDSESTGADPLLPDLWHQWNGDLVDQISGQQATKIGNPVLADDTVVLDGLSAGIEILHFGAAYRDSIDGSTVAMRYYAESNAGFRSLLCLGGAGEDLSTNAFVLVIRDGSIELVTETGLGEDHVVVLGEAPAAGEWHDLVLVTDAGAASLYIDGVWVDTNPYVAAETDSETLRMGVTGWTSSWWWGAFDDLRIWTRPLSESEIASL